MNTRRALKAAAYIAVAVITTCALVGYGIMVAVIAGWVY